MYLEFKKIYIINMLVNNICNCKIVPNCFVYINLQFSLVNKYSITDEDKIFSVK